MSGIKIHTIRKDTARRWKVGMTAHMWMHSPRNINKHPFQFAEAIVSKICDININKHETETGATWLVHIDGRKLSGREIDALAKSDGFDSGWQFMDWFQQFDGRLIFWTDLREVVRAK